MRRRGMSLLMIVLVLVIGFTASAIAKPTNYTAHLTGAAEVPSVETQAVGQAVFQLSRDGTELNFRLIVANIENVTMAHIHCAPEGVNGPVIVWLYPAEGPPPAEADGRFSGVLSTGTITDDDVGACGDVNDVEGLVELIEAGGTYVNVHTSQYPAGEVRGQIR